MTELTDQQLLRYSRQIFLPNVDVQGQEKLNAAHVVIMGVGGLGSLSAAYLVGAGVGKLTLVDDDIVDITNLHRQLLYVENDIGRKKVESAALRLSLMNADSQLNTVDRRLSVDQLQSLFDEADLVLDGTDNFATRLQINEACFLSKTPLVSAAVTQFSGQLSTYNYVENTPCYQCVYPVLSADADGAENNCAENGVLGPNVGMMASVQALHAIKFLLGLNVESLHRLMVIDMLNDKQRNITLQTDNSCPICGKR
jgi:adenylyltransferase/sulfurtransferase